MYIIASYIVKEAKNYALAKEAKSYHPKLLAKCCCVYVIIS